MLLVTSACLQFPVYKVLIWPILPIFSLFSREDRGPYFTFTKVFPPNINFSTDIFHLMAYLAPVEKYSIFVQVIILFEFLFFLAFSCLFFYTCQLHESPLSNTSPLVIVSLLTCYRIKNEVVKLVSDILGQARRVHCEVCGIRDMVTTQKLFWVFLFYVLENLVSRYLNLEQVSW